MDVNRYVQEYCFGELLQSPYRNGWYDEVSQCQCIYPCDQARESDGFLIIGSAGVDGIEFGYRKGQSGIWAHYPIDDRYVLLAPTIDEFVCHCKNGSIIL